MRVPARVHAASVVVTPPRRAVPCSGVPRERLAELHGNVFAERCRACGREFVRDFEMETVGFKRTGRRCDGCGGALHDHVLDWEDALPPDELVASEEHAREADVALCLGTSLQITPACNLPLKAVRTYRGGAKQERESGLLLLRTSERGRATRARACCKHRETNTLRGACVQLALWPLSISRPHSTTTRR